MIVEKTEPEKKIIAVFGSSHPREGEADYEQARLLGRALAEKGFSICSGGYGGVMEAVSRGAKESGGRTLGITFKSVGHRANSWVDEEHEAATWEERLLELIRLGDGYVACKGGTGTLAELAVVWEMLNKRAMPAKPFVTLGEFWIPIVERVREVELLHARSREANERLVHAGATPAAAAEFLARTLQPTAPASNRTVHRSTRKAD